MDKAIEQALKAEKLKAEVKHIHISEVVPGMTIFHNGEIKTLCRCNIRRGGFFGVSIWGDSYDGGYKPVVVLDIFRALPNKKVEENGNG